MLGSSDLVAFVATTDGPRARAFYEGTLGLRFVEESPFALVFDAHGTMLRVAKVQKLAPQPFTVLGWNVPDVSDIVAKLRAAGIALERYPFLEHDADGIWTAPGGSRIGWFRDPDGNVLSVASLSGRPDATP